MISEKERKRQGVFMLMLTALIWGVAFVAQSVGMNYVGPYTFNFVRFLIGGAVLIPCMLIFGKKVAGEKTFTEEEKKTRHRAGVTGGLCCGFFLFLASTLQQFGILDTTVGKAGFITALYIVIVPILGIFLKKKVSGKIWAAVLLALAGMYLLCMKSGFGISKGDLLVFLCAVVFSFHILTVDFFAPKTDGVFMSCIQFFTAGTLSAIFAFIYESPRLGDILRAWEPVLYAGVLSCGVAYTLQILGQKRLKPAVASLILCLESVFSALAGWLILGQTMSAREITGCGMVFAAILLAQYA